VRFDINSINIKYYCLLEIGLILFPSQVFCCCCFIFAVLGFELRTLHLLSRYSTTWVIPPALLLWVIFEIGYHFILRPPWTTILRFMFSHSWDDKCMPPCPTFYSLRCHKQFAQAGFELWSFSSISTSWVVASTGVSHHTWPVSFCLVWFCDILSEDLGLSCILCINWLLHKHITNTTLIIKFIWIYGKKKRSMGVRVS
jgi:hypothetical protein